MITIKKISTAAAVGLALTLAGCGGGGSSDQFAFEKIVSFGDSLSDVGTYSVGTVKALGGGKYTINDGTNNTIWVENIAKTVGVSLPCPAMQGLQGDAAQGFSVIPQSFANCYGYAQGGARVTNPVGPGNKALGGANAVLGQLTVPVVTQIANHLTKTGGAFSQQDLVLVMAGGNDVFINLSAVGAGAASPTDAVTAMGTAGAELAGYVRTQIVGKGARYVVVVNLPDVSKTPFGYSLDAATQGLVSTMSATFNQQLASGVSSLTDQVVLVDAYTTSRDQAASPAKYGILNGTLPACDLDATKNPLQSSLVCTKANLIPGETSKYQFADTVHPTPFGHTLISDAVRTALRTKGWAN